MMTIDVDLCIVVLQFVMLSDLNTTGIPRKKYLHLAGGMNMDVTTTSVHFVKRTPSKVRGIEIALYPVFGRV